MKHTKDTSCTDEIICPHCGFEFSDSWEENEGQEDIGVLKCYECEKSFFAQRTFDVSYTTKKYGTCEKCGAEDEVLDEAPYIFNGLVCDKCWREDFKEWKQNGKT